MHHYYENKQSTFWSIFYRKRFVAGNVLYLETFCGGNVLWQENFYVRNHCVGQRFVGKRFVSAPNKRDNVVEFD